MWRHHTQTNGWSDIPQHASIAPDAAIEAFEAPAPQAARARAQADPGHGGGDRRHQQSRRRGRARTIASDTGLVGVQFSACLDSEVAYEKNGAGEFTGVTTRLLAQARGQTNRAFHDAIIKGFGPSPRQTPKLYCDPDVLDAPLALF